MTTEKQIEANRCNAQKSTGPKTPAGKARSSRNATTHGLIAQALILENDQNEAIEDFMILHAELQLDLEPDGRLEELLVQRIAVCHWRLNRSYRYEAQSVLAARRAEANCVDRDPVPIVLPREADLDRLVRYEGLIDRELNRCLAQFYRIRTRRRRQEAHDEPDEASTLNRLLEVQNLISQVTGIEARMRRPDPTPPAEPASSAGGRQEVTAPCDPSDETKPSAPAMHGPQSQISNAQSQIPDPIAQSPIRHRPPRACVKTKPFTRPRRPLPTAASPPGRTNHRPFPTAGASLHAHPGRCARRTAHGLSRFE